MFVWHQENVTALFGIFLETNKHQHLKKLRHSIANSLASYCWQDCKKQKNNFYFIGLSSLYFALPQACTWSSHLSAYLLGLDHKHGETFASSSCLTHFWSDFHHCMNSLWFSNKKLVYCLHGHIMQKTSLLYWQIVHSPSSVFYTSAPQDASVLFLTVLVAVTYDMFSFDLWYACFVSGLSQ